MQSKLKKAAIIAFWLLIWQLLAMIINNDIFFPNPLAVVCRLMDLAITGHFWQSILNSFVRIFLGFLLAFLAGYYIALLSYEFRGIHQLLYPVIITMKAVPVAAMVVIISMLAGSDKLAFFVTFMVVFPISYLAIFEGLLHQDIKLIEMAKLYRISYWKKYKYIYRFQLEAPVLAAVKATVGLSFKSGVAAELICMAKDSIGMGIYSSKIYFDTAAIMAWTIVVILLSYIVEKILAAVPRLLIQSEEARRNIKSRGISSENLLQAEEAEDIEIKALNKTFGDLKVIDNYNALYKASSVTKLESPAGSGKTTLLRLIAGLEKDDSGKNLDINKKISYLFQEDRLIENTTVYNNLLIVNRNLSQDYLAMLLNKAGLRNVLFEQVSDLSGGMKRKIALLRALLYPSSILLLDEPFTGMDRESIERMQMLIKELKANRTVIVASHIVNDL